MRVYVRRDSTHYVTKGKLIVITKNHTESAPGLLSSDLAKSPRTTRATHEFINI